MRGRPCIFGEVLFDHFPDGTRVLGGAPFNVAWHLQAFGRRPRFISRVGRDPEGEAVREAMRTWGMDTTGLQTDPRQPTGRVSVLFDDGEPSYDIVHPCAYDAIEAVAAGLRRLRTALSRQPGAARRHFPAERAGPDDRRTGDGIRRRQPATAVVGQGSGPGHGAPSPLGQT